MMSQDPAMQNRPQGQPVDPAGGLEVEKFEATPEQQAQYEAVVNEALNAVSDTPDKFESFMDAISTGGERSMQVVAMVVVAMIDAAEKKTGPVQDDDVLEGVAEALISEVYGMAVEEGVLPPEVVNEDVFTATYMEFAIAWAQAHPERMDEEDQRAMEEMLAEREAAQGGIPGEQNAMAKGVAQGSRPPQKRGLLAGGMA